MYARNKGFPYKIRGMFLSNDSEVQEYCYTLYPLTDRYKLWHVVQQMLILLDIKPKHILRFHEFWGHLRKKHICWRGKNGHKWFQIQHFLPKCSRKGVFLATNGALRRKYWPYTGSNIPHRAKFCEIYPGIYISMAEVNQILHPLVTFNK